MTKHKGVTDAMLEEAARLGCKATVENRRKHKAIVLTKNGRSRFLIVGHTPSDWRAERNQIRDMRRMVRELDVTQSEGVRR